MRRVIVVPYDPSWPGLYNIASQPVATALGPNLLALHHIGSTAIPGIHAKPVIDMLAIVSDIAATDGAATAAMNAIGYEALGEFGIPGRRYFRRDNPAGVRTHQVHAFSGDSPHLPRHLAFRDFLRAHPDLATQYGTLKQKLAALHPTDINAYMEGKDAFIKTMELKALAWANLRNPSTKA